MDINNGSQPQFLTIVETSLSANQPLTQVQSDKFNWRGIGDQTSLTQFLQSPVDRGGLRGVALEPQRIRSFTVTFNQQEEVAAPRAARTKTAGVRPIRELKVVRTKEGMRPLNVIKNHRLEVSVHGKENVKYTKNILEPHDPAPARAGSPTTKQNIKKVKTNSLPLSGAHDYHRQNGIGDQTPPGKPAHPTSSKSETNIEAPKNQTPPLKQVTIKKV